MKLSKHGDYERRVLFPVFSNFQVRIIFSNDIGKSYAVRFKRPLSRDIDMTNAFHASSSTGVSHLFFRIGNCTSGTVAHEVVHAVMSLLVNWVGVEKMDDEVLAYHVGYLVDQVVDCCNELIDAGVGVKFKTEVQPNVSDSQGSTGGMRRLQSREKKKSGDPRTA